MILLADVLYVFNREVEKARAFSQMYKSPTTMLQHREYDRMVEAYEYATNFLTRNRWNMNMSQAPRDGTMLQLKVAFTENPIEDVDLTTPVVTIGFNDEELSGEIDWKFAGWCWSHDQFTAGKGHVIAWREILEG